MSSNDDKNLLLVWKLLHGITTDQMRNVFLEKFEKTFRVPWTDTTENRIQFQ